MLKKLLFLLIPITGFAQNSIPLNDLSAFKNPSANWTIEGGVTGNFNGNPLTPIAGKGVLLNTLRGAKYQATDDLYSVLEHGDIKISLDFMIPKGSNSGLYLQSRYEVQIYDTWLKKPIVDNFCGAIYHRWDESRGKGNEGYEGHPPRQNAVKAPGLWNHLEIDFKAPTFDATGKKLTNARFNSVYLNGLLIHENVELLGVTRGSTSPQEVAKAPFRIQGDHGQVAFKNMMYEVFEKSDISFTPVTYEVTEGVVSNFKQTNPKTVAYGTLAQPTQKVIDAKKDFLAKYQGKFTTKVADNYTIIGQWEAVGAVVVDGDTIIKGYHLPFEYAKGSKKLSAGEHSYTILYTKDYNWRPNSLGIFIQKDQWEKQAITERTSLLDMVPVPLIDVKPTDQPAVQRSFIMYGNKKISHGINVGMPDGLSFSYDLNQGGFLQLWRGKFLNTTDMWLERGEPQTSAAMGMTIQANDKFPLAYLNNNETEFPENLTKEDLKYKGYKLEKYLNNGGYPNFMYEYKGLKIKDLTTPMEKSEGLNRHLVIDGEVSVAKQLYALIAEGTDIAEVASNRYGIDNQAYYVEVVANPNNKPFIRESKGKKQLLMPLAGLKEVSYNVIF
jgi:Domain of Unknown Function (DUF1080)